MFESQLKMSLNKPFPKNYSLADIMRKPPKMFVMPRSSIDDLLIELSNNDVGCHMGHYFVGALGYADDLILLSPTVYGLELMIIICENYAK